MPYWAPSRPIEPIAPRYWTIPSCRSAVSIAEGVWRTLATGLATSPRLPDVERKTDPDIDRCRHEVLQAIAERPCVSAGGLARASVHLADRPQPDPHFPAARRRF